MNDKWVVSCVLLIAGLFVATAQAQDDAGSLLNQQLQQPQQLPRQLPKVEELLPMPEQKDRGMEKIRITSIEFEDAGALVSESELQFLVASSIGKEFDFAGLELLAQQITQYLRSKGFLLAEAYFPQQEITKGNIVIAIRDGRVQEIDPYAISPAGKLPLRINQEVLKGIALSAQRAGEAVRSENLERAMLLMSDLPGIAAKARLEPGDEPGATRVVLDVEEGPLFAATGWLDNFGSRDTGLAEVNMSASLNDPLRIGDQATIALTHSLGVDLARLGYAIPLGSRGVSLGGSVTSMDYEIIRGTGKEAGLKGESDVFALTLSYPFVRSRSKNVYGSLGYSYKVLKDDSAAGLLRDKRLGAWTLGFWGDRSDMMAGGGYGTWNIAVTSGNLDLSRVPLDEAIDAISYQTQGGFAKLNYGVSRVQRLKGQFVGVANISGQMTGQNLNSSEKYILGGLGGVRAYSGNEAQGDAGAVLNLELHYSWPGWSRFGDLEVSGFYDVGYVKLYQDTNGIPAANATGKNEYALFGWGVGATLTRSGSYMMRLNWARKIGENPGRDFDGLNADGLKDRSRIWAQAVVWF